MGINITFREQPELQHINLRRQGDEHSAIICADLKLSGMANVGDDGELFCKLLGCEPEHARSFWREPEYQTDALTGEPALPDGQPEIAFFGITSIKSWAAFEGHHSATVRGLQLRPAKLHKFEIKPRPGFLADLTLSMTIESISEREIEILAMSLGDKVSCTITADPDLFDGDERSDGQIESVTISAGGESVTLTADDAPGFGWHQPDPLYPDAVAFVRETHRASISALQRRLKVGYNRAARILEQLETTGVVSTQNEHGQRAVMVTA